MAFGPQQIPIKTPEWAKWMFRITLLLTTAALFVISGDPAITDAFKVRIGVYLKGLDIIVYGFSKMFGIEGDIKYGDDKN